MCSRNSYIKSRNHSRKTAVSLNVLKPSALGLKVEGYEHVAFDSVIDADGKRIRVHVFANDAISSCAAVFCMHKAEEVESGQLAKDVDSIGNHLNCILAVAIPTPLMDLTYKIANLVSGTYPVDVMTTAWVHNVSSNFELPPSPITGISCGPKENQSRVCETFSAAETGAYIA